MVYVRSSEKLLVMNEEVFWKSKSTLTVLIICKKYVATIHLNFNYNMGRFNRENWFFMEIPSLVDNIMFLWLFLEETHTLFS